MLNIQLDPFPQLESGRLILREITEADVQELYALRSNEEAMKYLDIPKLADLQAALLHIRKLAAWREEKVSVSWGIALKEDPKLIGTILFKNILAAHHRAEVGYMLMPQYWRRGIAREALHAVLNHGFNTMQFHSIEAVVNPDNQASIRLLEQQHFIREGYFRENYYFEGKFLDSAVYSLLRSSYRRETGR